MDKYFKMLNFGVPSSGVAQKMAQDNMPPEKIANFVAGPDGSHVSTYNGATRKRERAELEGAQGITFASLLKLSETKAVDQSMTLLQFIVKLIHDRGEGTEDLKFQPHQYKMESNFISVMRDRLLNIKAAFEDVEMELETLHSVWDGTARYLAEDPVGSSSEYVFGLLNRFLLDVKVAKSLLFRKGLSFANEANAVLPHAYVGSIVATKFGEILHRLLQSPATKSRRHRLLQS
ncbi:hypothetical protein PR002_g6852 [Phytophthora rubi]|uniref:Uncharacterized protein n=1 Tax=Phytophthora rubi TaxID=129364 RepID=A0A6A3MYN6_9STRA|nr:hypothetical protein PR002_g6852 [Phytophthora rubi]